MSLLFDLASPCLGSRLSTYLALLIDGLGSSCGYVVVLVESPRIRGGKEYAVPGEGGGGGAFRPFGSQRIYRPDPVFLAPSRVVRKTKEDTGPGTEM